MIENNDIILFSNDWGGDPLSKHQIAVRLAAKNRVLWVNSMGNRNPTVSAHDLRRVVKKVWQFLRGCRPVANNIFRFCPLVLPFHGNRAARWINRRLLAWGLRHACRKLSFRDPITLTFVPNSVDVVGTLGERLVIYYCVDEYSQFTGADRAAVLDLERRLMEKADLVVVSASRLYESKRGANANTILITHGVDVDHFRAACLESMAIPEDVAMLPGPVIGFYGLIEDWVDLEAIRHMAAARPEWSFLMIGEVKSDTSAARKQPNVHFLGRRPYQSLPGYCKKFDIAVLPFVVNELTLASNPLKLREYLAAGLPVVATPLPEVEKLGELVRMATTPKEFLEQCDALLAAGRRGPEIAVSRQMDGESWDGKVELLSEHIAGLVGPAFQAAAAFPGDRCRAEARLQAESLAPRD
jgi:glycosyltransferase involved in cell wall biosynthesis